MKKDELLAELNVKSFFFSEEQGPALFFSFDGDHVPLERLTALAQKLDELIPDDPNLHINTALADHKYQIMLSEKNGNGIIFHEVSGMSMDYNEILQKKSVNETIKIGFYLYNVRVQRTEEELLKIRSHEDFDDTDAVTGEEDYYISIKIPVGKRSFIVRSDDNYSEGPAGFEELNPAAAAAVIAWREEQEKKK